MPRPNLIERRIRLDVVETDEGIGLQISLHNPFIQEGEGGALEPSITLSAESARNIGQALLSWVEEMGLDPDEEQL